VTSKNLIGLDTTFLNTWSCSVVEAFRQNLKIN